MTSATRSAIRFASSLTTIISGSCTSRTCFSARIDWPSALARAFSCLRFIAASDRVRPPSPPASACVSDRRPVRRLSSALALALASLSPALPVSRRSRSVRRGAPVATPLVSAREAAASAAARSAGASDAGFAVTSAFFWARTRASSTLRASSSSLARSASTRSRSSRSFASISARRRSRSSSRARSSAARAATSPASRALAAASAFSRRSISASEIPAGRFEGSEATAAGEFGRGAAPPAAPAADGLGTTTRLRLVSTTTLWVRPWLKLCFTWPGRPPPRPPPTPRGFFPSLSLIRSRILPGNRIAVMPAQTVQSCGVPYHLVGKATRRKRAVYDMHAAESQTQF